LGPFALGEVLGKRCSSILGNNFPPNDAEKKSDQEKTTNLLREEGSGEEAKNGEIRLVGTPFRLSRPGGLEKNMKKGKSRVWGPKASRGAKDVLSGGKAKKGL